MLQAGRFIYSKFIYNFNKRLVNRCRLVLLLELLFANPNSTADPSILLGEQASTPDHDLAIPLLSTTPSRVRT